MGEKGRKGHGEMRESGAATRRRRDGQEVTGESVTRGGDMRK